MRVVPEEEARAFIEEARFAWHQRFELGGGVYAPGGNDVERLLDLAGIPRRLDGASVLDIGAANGGVCFELERRGAGRVVGMDLAPAEHFGFRQIGELLGSRAEFVQGSVYELPRLLDGPFDLVVCWGVLYHLRHPLLALDAVRGLTGGWVSIECEISDSDVGEVASRAVARFARGSEENADASNWFIPTAKCLLDWCRSSGLDPLLLATWPAPRISRCMIKAVPVPGEPEFALISPERPLQVTQEVGRQHDDFFCRPAMAHEPGRGKWPGEPDRST